MPGWAPLGIKFLEFRGRIKDKYFSADHNGDTLAELVSLFHVMGCEQDGGALLIKRTNTIPQEETRLRIKAVSWFIKKKHIGEVHQSACEHESLGHTTRVTHHLIFATITKAEFLRAACLRVHCVLCVVRHGSSRETSIFHALANCDRGCSAGERLRYAV